MSGLTLTSGRKAKEGVLLSLVTSINAGYLVIVKPVLYLPANVPGTSWRTMLIPRGDILEGNHEHDTRLSVTMLSSALVQPINCNLRYHVHPT